jgi:hypothetical protein
MSVTLSADPITEHTRGVLTSLAWFEGKRLLKSPFLWLATAGSIAAAWAALQSQYYTTLEWRSAALAGACLPLAAVALLMANAAALRDRAADEAEVTIHPPVSVDQRKLGLAMAAWAPALLSLLVIAVGLPLAILDEAGAGFVLPAEIAVGPLVVVLGHVTGVALGRWIRSHWAAAMTLVVLAGLFLIKDLLPGARVIPAASPFLPWRAPYTEWVLGEGREPVFHIIYLVALIAALAALAARAWRLLVVNGLTVAAAAFLLSGVPVGGSEVAASADRWQASQPRVCEDHTGVRLCVMEGYEKWIPSWAAALDRVDELVPVGLQVREIQYSLTHPRFDGDPQVAHTSGYWDPNEGFDLVYQLLAPELGIPGTAEEAVAFNEHLPECMARMRPVMMSGQARAIAFLILNEMASPGSLTDRVGPIGGRDSGTVRNATIEVSSSEAALALQIADLPEDSVLSTLHPRWETVTDPSTTSETLAAWFGLPAPEVATTSEWDQMNCVCTDDGISCTG